MKIYDDRNKTREIQCNYCYANGHNKRNCPTMKAHWDANKHLDPETAIHDDLVGVDTTMFPKYYQSYWGDQTAHRQYFNHLAYMTKRFAPKSETNPKKRKKVSCGFCASKAHTRRNCNKMKNFVYVLNETNKAFRSQYYDRFIEGMGLGAGALVEQRIGDRWSEIDKTTVAIVSAFPTDSIMFTNKLYRWSDYHTSHSITTLPNGVAMKISQSGGGMFFDRYTYENGVDHDRNTELYGHFGYMFSGVGQIMKVVSPAPNRPSKEWFMGQSPCFDFIVKKRKIDQLMYDLGSTIKKFYPHNNLRSKLGAKIYDQYFTR
jgi:hypothetical protein